MGPNEQELRKIVSARAEALDGARRQWKAGKLALVTVRNELDTAVQQIEDQFGRHSRQGARARFIGMRSRVVYHQQSLEFGRKGLEIAALAIAEAQAVVTGWDGNRARDDQRELADDEHPVNQPIYADQPEQPGQQTINGDGHAQTQVASTQTAGQGSSVTREEQAGKALKRLNHQFDLAIEQFRMARGEAPPEVSEQYGDGPGEPQVSPVGPHGRDYSNYPAPTGSAWQPGPDHRPRPEHSAYPVERGHAPGHAGHPMPVAPNGSLPGASMPTAVDPYGSSLSSAAAAAAAAPVASQVVRTTVRAVLGRRSGSSTSATDSESQDGEGATTAPATGPIGAPAPMTGGAGAGGGAGSRAAGAMARAARAGAGKGKRGLIESLVEEDNWLDDEGVGSGLIL